MEDIFINVLRRYIEIQSIQKQLNEEKNQLKKILDRELINAGCSVLVTDMEENQVRVSKTERVKISYAEDILKERLGSQYSSILSLDMDKIKKKQDQLSMILDAKSSSEFSSPDRLKIKNLIENKIVEPGLFKDAFSKEVKTILYVTSKPKNIKGFSQEKPF